MSYYAINKVTVGVSDDKVRNFNNEIKQEGKRFTYQISTQQIDRLIIEILLTHAHPVHIIVLISVLIKSIVQIVLETLV